MNTITRPNIICILIVEINEWFCFRFLAGFSTEIEQVVHTQAVCDCFHALCYIISFQGCCFFI